MSIIPKSVKESVNKILNKPQKTKVKDMISFYEPVPLKQIMFDHASYLYEDVLEGSGKFEVSILVIVDVSTRYTHYRVVNSKTKTDAEKALKEFYDKAAVDLKHLLIDGEIPRETYITRDNAQAFKTIKHPYHKDGFSFIYKKITHPFGAVLAEFAISRMRHYIRRWEYLIKYTNRVRKTKYRRMTKINMQKYLDYAMREVNKNLQIKQPKYANTKDKGAAFKLGDPVWLYSIARYKPLAITANATRRHKYDSAFYHEIYYISSIIWNPYQKKYKYGLSSYTQEKALVFYFYENELRRVAPDTVLELLRYNDRNKDSPVLLEGKTLKYAKTRK